jgi:hypothetical protein
MDPPMGPIPPYNAETIKAMEDVKEGKNVITIPLDELFDEECGKEKQPTDDELVDKLIAEYLFLFNARLDLDVKDSEDVRDILRLLIKDVKR